MESCPPGSTKVADRGGLQPHHLTGLAMVPPCWVTGPEGLRRAGCLQQVRWGGKSGTAKKRRGKDNEGERRQGLKQKGREKTGMDEQRGGRPGGRGGGETPRQAQAPCPADAWRGLAWRPGKAKPRRFRPGAGLRQRPGRAGARPGGPPRAASA